MKKIVFIFMFIFLLSAVSFSQLTYLVKDFSTMTNASSPRHIIESGEYIYFSAFESVHGRELWRTDGTEEGTVLLIDLLPGVESGIDDDFYAVDVNGELFFYYDRALWITNGTVDGTVIVKTAENFVVQLEEPLINLDGTLYFNPQSRSVWKSDGTEAGTVLLAGDISTAGVSPDMAFSSANGLLYFIGWDEICGYELWKTDGTVEGTMLVKDIIPGTESGIGSYISSEYLSSDGVLFFSATNGVDGYELWKTDGTASGTMQVKDINVSGNSSPSEFIGYNNEIYFLANDGVSGRHLWKTDGTSSGTNLVFSAEDNPIYNDFSIYNGELYFTVKIDYVKNLYKTLGTPISTSIVLHGNVKEYVVADNQMFLNYIDTSYIGGIYKLNSTNDDAIFLDNLKYINYLTPLGNNCVFQASDSTYYGEIWLSDGTTEGTNMIKDINRLGSSLVNDLVDVNGRLFFEAKTVEDGKELWCTNGHESGTYQVCDLSPVGDLYLGNFTNFKNKLYFTNADLDCDNDPSGILCSDGTSNGTSIISGEVDYVRSSCVYNNQFFVVTNDDLWKTDGTPEGTDLLFTEEPFGLDKFEVIGNNVYLNVEYPIYKLKKFNLDNNEISVIFEEGTPQDLINFSDSLFFTSNLVEYDTVWYDPAFPEWGYYLNETYSSSFFKYYPMSEEVIELYNDLIVNKFIVINSNLFVYGRKNGVYGLYCTNSPSDSIALVREITDNSGQVDNFINFDGRLVFSLDDGLNGNELWISDGTLEGTHIVKDINPIGDSNPCNIVCKNEKMYFAADDGINGVELWESDGTENGTILLEDINPNGDSSLSRLTISGNTIFFVANDGETGFELWAHGLTTTENCFAYFNTNYDTIQNTFYVNVDDITIDNSIEYFWNFGDGETSCEESPEHTYEADSVYTLCLTAYSDMQDSCQYCRDLGKDQYNNIIKSEGFNLVIGAELNNLDFEYENESYLSLFPNPTSSFIHLKTNMETDAHTKIKLFDSNGKIIFVQEYCDDKIIDFRNVKNGVYFLLIENIDNTHIVRKIIVKK